MFICQIALLFKRIFLLRNAFCIMYWLKMFWNNSVSYNFLDFDWFGGEGSFSLFHIPMLYFQIFERGEAEYRETRVQGHLTRQKVGRVWR